jgi:hypothetical protein
MAAYRSMYRVIDTIIYNETSMQRFPDIAWRGEGLLAILDPDQIQELPDISGRPVSILRPDGSWIDLVAASSEVRNSVVAIFFEGASRGDIPPGSQFKW